MKNVSLSVSNIPLLKSAHPDSWDTLTSLAKRHVGAKGYILFSQNDPATTFYVIESGWVKLFTETTEGEEMILDLLTGNDIFGETTYFYEKTYPFSAEIIEDTIYWTLPTSWIEFEIKNHPPFAMAMMQHMARIKMGRDKQLEHHTLQDAPQRVGCFILRLCQKKRSGSIKLTFPVDKHLIANHLGMKPETFSRALSKLSDELGVEVDGMSVKIPHLEKLISFTCRTCSNIFPCGD